MCVHIHINACMGIFLPYMYMHNTYMHIYIYMVCTSSSLIPPQCQGDIKMSFPPLLFHCRLPLYQTAALNRGAVSMASPPSIPVDVQKLMTHARGLLKKGSLGEEVVGGLGLLPIGARVPCV